MNGGRMAHRWHGATRWIGVLLAMGGLSGPPGAGSSLTSPRRPKMLEEPVSGMRLVRLEAGSFEMGSPASEPMREAQEQLHLVRLSHPFYLGETEVTQEQWARVIGQAPAPSYAATCGLRCPVENVSFEEVQEFLLRLNARSSTPRYRLPTEAEWEYACRAGTTTPFSTGKNLTTDEANFHGGHPYAGAKAGRYRGGPAPVRSFPSNGWGLFDMHGNAWEWCQDWHCPYDEARANDPVGQCASKRRVIRGGSWAFGADSARCALRYTHEPQDRGPSLGFRVARDDSP